MNVRAHTCYLGHTGFAAHARNFFRELSKHVNLRVRNYTWDSNPQLDEIDYSILDKITLRNSDNTESDYPISYSFPNLPWSRQQEDFKQDIDIVLMDMHHNYFYQEYSASIKIAYTVWESTELEENFFNQLLKFDYLWVVSKWHKEMVIKQGYPEERVAIINEGVNSIFFDNHTETNNDKFKFMFFGRWDYRKSVPEIIETFIKSFPNNDNIELILSADNPYSIDGFNSTEERLEHYKFNDARIKVLHFPKYEEYVNYIKTGNVLITCARSEGWNIPLIEAMAAGTPTIYSNWGAQLEFAEGLGNPINIKTELPANIGRDLGFAGETPGFYAEPDFDDLGRVLIDCYDNYQDKKIKALEESKIIKDKFNWNKIAKDGLIELRKVINRKEAIVIMSHANNELKLELLNRNILKCKENGFSVILSSHIKVPDYISELCDYVVIDKENPIVCSKEEKVYTNCKLHTFWDYPEFNVIVPFEYNHSYAALKLIKNGFAIAEYNGFEKIHMINYDYIINYETLNKHSNLLNDNECVGYYWDPSEKISINSGFFSVSNNFGQIIKSINSKKEYYRYENTSILEAVLGSCIFDSGIKYHLSNIDSIQKDDNLINIIEVENRWIVESGCIAGKFNNDYYIFIDGTKNLKIKTDKKERNIKSGRMFFIKINPEDISKGVVITDENKTFENIFNIKNCIGEFKIRSNSLIEDMEENTINLESPKIIINYNNGAFVEILGGSYSKYNVKFINNDTNQILYENTINKNCWTKCLITYYINWRIEILNLDTNETSIHNLDLNNKEVRVKIDSSSLGDTIAWLPHINEFAEKHNCNVIVSTFKNFLFDLEKYPRLKFVNPGEEFDSYATYNIGWFYDNDNFNKFKNPRDFKNIPLQAVTTDILGLKYNSLKPFIKIKNDNRPLKSKYICIAIHSTAQAKYWNNPKGWQEITDHYISNGYEVVLVSLEENGYMGNKNPEGVIYMKDKSMDTLISYLSHCELFIGISSGISWLSWALNKKTVIISGFSKPITEPLDDNIIRIFNQKVCNGCFNIYRLDAGDWNWCPINKGTQKQFECSKSITAKYVIDTIESGIIPKFNFEIEFIPNKRENLKLAEQPFPSAWGNIPSIIKDIIERFEINTSNALEFGVEYGYSTSALANYFDNVIGVDIFTGDIHSGLKEDHLEQTKSYLESYKNITLVKSDYRDFIKTNSDFYGLTHIDIIHNFEHTYECGEWAVQHSRVTIFHDTESYPEVKRACQELANNYDLEFYNYKESYGLGILVNKKINK